MITAKEVMGWLGIDLSQPYWCRVCLESYPDYELTLQGKMCPICGSPVFDWVAWQERQRKAKTWN